MQMEDDDDCERKLWDKELTKLFITQYKANPCLYDPSHPDFKDKKIRTDAYETILEEMQIFKPQLKVANLKRKIRTLQSQLSKERSRIGKIQQPANDEPLNRNNLPSLWCYNDLLFLSPFCEQHGTTSRFGDWNQNLITRFIYLYKEFPCLYNPMDKHFRNDAKRHECFVYILNELKKLKPLLTFEAVQRKLRTLLYRFSVTLSEKAGLLSDERNSKGGKPSLWYYNDLLFLAEFHDMKAITSWDIDSDIESENCEQQDETPQSGGGNYRVRNILTLEERVRAIEAYDRKPMYTKVASMFNCSWEQIKNVIQNRKAIMDFYHATRVQGSCLSPDEEQIRRRKIAFLGECIYEYIQRAQFHANAHLSEEIIRAKANEFRELMQIENFVPNRAWLNQFKLSYNISFSQRQILLTRTPPASLDLKSIMTYCSRHVWKDHEPPAEQTQTNKPLYKLKTTMDLIAANTATVEELRARRERKINFLEKALYEYIQRAQFHHKTPLNEELQMKIARELKDMLKIENFVPNKNWLKHFKQHYNFSTSQHTIVLTRTPPFSLDLKDILSYCSRVVQKNCTASPAAIKTNAQPKIAEKQSVADVEPQPQSQAQPPSQPQPQSQPQPPSQPQLQSQPQPKPPLHVKLQLPPQTIIQKKFILNPAVQSTPMVTIEAKDLLEKAEKEESDIKPNITDIKIELLDDDESDDKPPPTKKQKLDSPDQVKTNNQKEPEQPIHSPGHWSEQSSDDEELPKHAKSYADALRLLKPLEEFAMLEENYRAIGLITQLESLFKNPPTKTSRREST